MKTIKGPAIFLAQFMGEEPPFNALETICKWASELGYKGIQMPTTDERLIDLEKAAASVDYSQELKGKVEHYGLTITELSTHLQGQLVAVHPAYDILFDGFAPPQKRGNFAERTKWAVNQLKLAAKASKNLAMNAHVSFSGSLLWPMMYPWPQRSKGLVDDGFKELAKRWTPILNIFDECGVDLCFELHPNEDLHDGITFERFLEETKNHPRLKILYDPSHFILQQLDYLQFIDLYYPFIKMFHVKDAEFIPSGKVGVYGGYQDWANRAGRFRSLGDGQVDFKQIFTKLTQYGFDGWAVLEWQCFIKHPEDGAKEGAKFIQEQLIRVTDKAFDDFAGTGLDSDLNKKVLGVD